MAIVISKLFVANNMLSMQHRIYNLYKRIIVVQLLSCVRLFVTPRTAACQASLSFIVSRSLLKLISIVQNKYTYIIQNNFLPKNDSPLSKSVVNKSLLVVPKKQFNLEPSGSFVRKESPYSGQDTLPVT